MNEEVEDYTRGLLRMPDDLQCKQSVLHGAAGQALTEEASQDVEVIGSLGQFYICERKDEVFAAF